MIIANPIYDSVFKYLLEDLNVAMLMLSAIIEEEIIHLEVRPQEMIAEIEGAVPGRSKQTGFPFVIYRLDFAAKIKKSNGEEEILLLELQKVHLLTDIFRFRKYLGEQLASKSNMLVENTSSGKLIVQKAIPIRPIYILGHGMEVIKDVPVIKIERRYIDVATLEVIPKKDPFIEALSHDAIVVCVEALEGKQRNDLEKMLNIFNQNLIMENEHFIAIDEKEYPQKFQPILRRLNMATQDAAVKQQMETEDVIIEELRLWDINLQMMKNIAEEAEAKAKEAEIKAKEAETKAGKAETKAKMAETEAKDAIANAQKEKTNAQKAEANAQKEKAEAEKAKIEAEISALNEKVNSARTLIHQGVPKDTVAIAFGISLEVLDQWIDNG